LEEFKTTSLCLLFACGTYASGGTFFLEKRKEKNRNEMKRLSFLSPCMPPPPEKGGAPWTMPRNPRPPHNVNIYPECPAFHCHHPGNNQCVLFKQTAYAVPELLCSLDLFVYFLHQDKK